MTNREAIQERAVEKLEEWFDREMDLLDRQFMSDQISSATYSLRQRELEREFREDMADIYAG